MQTAKQTAKRIADDFAKTRDVVATKRPCVREDFLDDIQISDDGDNAHLHSTTKDKG